MNIFEILQHVSFFFKFLINSNSWQISRFFFFFANKFFSTTKHFLFHDKSASSHSLRNYTRLYTVHRRIERKRILFSCITSRIQRVVWSAGATFTSDPGSFHFLSTILVEFFRKESLHLKSNGWPWRRFINFQLGGRIRRSLYVNESSTTRPNLSWITPDFGHLVYVWTVFLSLLPFMHACKSSNKVKIQI